MSAVADDRLLDFALRRLHGSAELADLTERIVEAWERGARGASLRDLDAAPQRAVEPAPSVRTTIVSWRRRAVAAAVLLVAGSATAVWIATREAAPVVLARVESPALVLRESFGSTMTTAELRDGDVLAAPSDVSSTLLLGGGRRFTADAGAVVALREHEHELEIELLRGGGSIEAGGGSVALDAGFVRAVAPAGAAATFERSFVPSAAFDTAWIEQLRELRAKPGAVRFAVASGELWLEHRGGRDRMVAGAEREVWNAVDDGGADLDGEKRVRVWVDAMLGRAPRFDPGRPVWNEMFTYLAAHPTRWATVLEAVAAGVGGAPKPGIAQPLLHFGLADPTGEGLAFVRALWLRNPECFSDLEIAALAERGVFEFEREAAAMLADDDGSRPRTLVLALLARRGDTRATEMLQRELDSERELFGGDYLRVAYAGYALAERGDATAWRRAIDALRPAFERDWSQRRFVDAAACVQLLRDFDRALTDGRPLPFETLMSKEVGAAYATAVDDPNVLRNDLDELARRR